MCPFIVKKRPSVVKNNRGAGSLKLFLVAIQNLVDVPLEKELRAPGKVIAQLGVEVVGGGVALPGVKAHNGFPLSPGRLLAEGDHLPGVTLAGLGGVDAHRVDDGHLFLLQLNVTIGVRTKHRC